jgi:uncharacterized protein
MVMQHVLITGGTGTIGKALSQKLKAKGYKVMIMSRFGRGMDPSITYYSWDLNKMQIDREAIEKADYIIHLAGAGVADKRWTAKRKQEIVNSRVESGKLIVKALTTIPNKVKAVVSASAIGWYGPDKKELPKNGFVETDEPYTDFLGDTCKQWEKAIEGVNALGIRLVKLRSGIVLSNEGGAFKEFKNPLQVRLATILGNGQQIISWIHIDDLCNQYIRAIENESWHGVYNAVAPYPVSNRELIIKMAEELYGSLFLTIPVPSFMLKLMLGEMSIEVLKSTTVSAQKIIRAGYLYQFPSIDHAVEDLLTPTSSRASDVSESK